MARCIYKAVALTSVIMGELSPKVRAEPLDPPTIKAPCWHGTFQNQTCTCDPDWRKSGPTDTIQFLKGVCDQYQCKSDEKCHADTGVKDSQCLVKGWNCYCGWSHAFAEMWTGYESFRDVPNQANGGGKCMGVLYVLSFAGGEAVWWWILNSWKLFLVLGIVALPFGQTHVRCQHHFPDMFRMMHHCYLLKLFGWDYHCRGDCTSQHVNSWSVYYDFAWTLYIFDLWIWTYCFLVALYAIFLVSWCVAMWIMVAVILIVAGIVACVGGMLACAGDGGGGGDCGGDCGGGPSADSCTCCGGGGGGTSGPETCGCCDGCCGGGADSGMGSDWFIYYNLNFDFYYGPSGTSSGDGCNSCCNCRCNIFYPIAWLILKFPKHPPNMWGGIFGRCVLGTHPACPNRYAGGNGCIDKLNFSSGTERRDEDWRQRVFAYINIDQNDEAGMQQTFRAQPRYNPQRVPAQNRMAPAGSPAAPGLSVQRRNLSTTLPATLIDDGGIRILEVEGNGVFDERQHRVQASSYKDYSENGKCWICMESGNEGWDLWTQCGHMFCSNCSSEMLRRHMPCPLCRQVSFSVRRGKKYHQEGYQPLAGE